MGDYNNFTEVHTMANPSPSAALSGGFGSHQSSCFWASYNATTGVSSGPFRYGNVSFGVGDDEFSVQWNRDRIKEHLGASTLLSARQVHEDSIYCCTTMPEGDTELDGYDALITNVQGLGLVIQQADCQGVLLFDEKAGAIGAIHSGWRGNVLNIIEKTVQAMSESFSSKPQNIRAYISPSLGPCCAEFINSHNEFPQDFHNFRAEKPNHFNFWKISQHQLLKAGVLNSNIEIAGICTSCNKDFFSYRRAHREGDGRTGRCCSAIVLDSL